MSLGHPHPLSVERLVLLWGPYNIEDVEHWLSTKYTSKRKDNNPIDALLMLTRWLHHPNTHHNDEEHWFKQVVDECLDWEWPLNSGVSEVYYALGHLLAWPQTASYVQNRWNDPNAMVEMLHWAQSLNSLKPFIRSSVGYQLCNSGLALYAPQEQMLNATLAYWMQCCPQESVEWNSSLLWRSPLARYNPEHTTFLAKKAPRTLAHAIEEVLLAASKDKRPPQELWPAIFAMPIEQSEPKELLHALVRCSRAKDTPQTDSHEQRLWNALDNVWPSYTQLVTTFREMVGDNVFNNSHPMHESVLDAVRAIQHNKRAPEYSVNELLNCGP